MSRSVALWSSDNPNAAIPKRVRVRVFERAGGCCEICGRKLGPADKWQADHIVALVNQGQHSEANLRVACDWCHKAKTREDVAIKAETYRVRSKHILPSEQKRSSFGTNRNSKFKKRMDGTVVLRATREIV